MHWTFFEVDESFVKYRDTRKIISLDALCFSCLTFRVILRHTTEGIVRERTVDVGDENFYREVFEFYNSKLSIS